MDIIHAVIEKVILPFEDALSVVTISRESWKWALPIEYNPEGYEALLNVPNAIPELGTILPRAITYCILLSLARFFLTIVLFKPMAIAGLKLNYNHSFKSDAKVDQALLRKKGVEPTAAEIAAFVKHHSGYSDATEVRAYCVGKMRQVKHDGRIVKFIEALWRFIFYSCFVALGIYCLLYPNMVAWFPILGDVHLFWHGWPHVPDAWTEFYYQIQIGAYLHQLIYTEVDRSDAAEMIVHHVVTLGLLIVSYCSNFTRIGSCILLLHDTADIFLEIGKTLHYIAVAHHNAFLESICDILFAIFAVTFFVTRICIYPYYMLWEVYYWCGEIVGRTFLGYPFFCSFLTILQWLHIFWFYLIFKMAVNLLVYNKMEDIRESDMEDEPEGKENEVSASDSGSSANNRKIVKKKMN
jgi:hypothetical protein